MHMDHQASILKLHLGGPVAGRLLCALEVVGSISARDIPKTLTMELCASLPSARQ